MTNEQIFKLVMGIWAFGAITAWIGAVMYHFYQKEARGYGINLEGVDTPFFMSLTWPLVIVGYLIYGLLLIAVYPAKMLGRRARVLRDKGL